MNENESAFPEITTDYDSDNNKYENTYSTGGLTKLEYFAGLAMQALLSNPDNCTAGYEVVSIDSVQYAKALIKELNK